MRVQAIRRAFNCLCNYLATNTCFARTQLHDALVVVWQTPTTGVPCRATVAVVSERQSATCPPSATRARLCHIAQPPGRH